MKAIFRVIRNITIIVLGLFLAMIATSGVHAVFNGFIDPLPMEDLSLVSWAEKVAIMEQFMKDNPLAIYSAVLGHGFGALVGTWFAVWSFHSFNKRGTMRGYRWSAAVVIGGLWLAADLQMDLIEIPVGPMWTGVDVAFTTIMVFVGYALGGGFTRRSMADLAPREDLYRG